MVEVDEAGFLSDFLFQLVDRAGGVDGVDAAAVGADEVVAMDAWEEEGEVSRAFVEAEAADHPFFGESLEKAEDGRFVALFRKVPAGGEFGQRHGPVVVGKAGENGLKGLSTAKTRGTGFGEEIVVKRHLRFEI